MAAVSEVACYSTVAMTLSLVVVQPRVGGNLRLSPAISAVMGVLVLVALGIIGVQGVSETLTELLAPFATIAAIMVMTFSAAEVGLLDWLARRVEAGCTDTRSLFRRVFVLSAICAATLNNDGAVLLLTPLVLRMASRRLGRDSTAIVPLAFGVFLAAGVAPLVVSNPMNMVVASFTGIGFNEYAWTMIPVSLVVTLISYTIAARLFRAELAQELNSMANERTRPTRAQLGVGILLFTVLIGYAVAGFIDAPLWPVAILGAVTAVLIGKTTGQVSARNAIVVGISWETLLFLACVLALSVGLKNVGFVDHLISHYDGLGTFGVGITSAVGSAILDNHPMANLNMLAFDAMPGAPHGKVFAALIGGDLGPRLLPMGSLAGLLWLGILRTHGVHVTTLRFVRIGVIATVPTLLAGLAVLSLTM